MAPLLEMWEPFPNTQPSLVNYIGPLSVGPDLSWVTTNTPFPISAFTAAGSFGRSLTSSEKVWGVFKSGQVQLFMIFTENEDAADVQTMKQFFANGGGPTTGHCMYVYPKRAQVPNTFVDPTGKFQCPVRSSVPERISDLAAVFPTLISAY